MHHCLRVPPILHFYQSHCFVAKPRFPFTQCPVLDDLALVDLIGVLSAMSDIAYCGFAVMSEKEWKAWLAKPSMQLVQEGTSVSWQKLLMTASVFIIFGGQQFVSWLRRISTES